MTGPNLPLPRKQPADFDMALRAAIGDRGPSIEVLDRGVRQEHYVATTVLKHTIAGESQCHQRRAEPTGEAPDIGRTLMVGLSKCR